jgi:SAM-dependent methyltransferase
MEKTGQRVDLYDGAYGKFEDEILAEVRRDTYGEDLGQSSWTTKDEYLGFIKLLELNSGTHVLDIACGSGNPTLFMVRQTNSKAIGIDINPLGIKAATKSAKDQGLESLASFKVVDANNGLPFPDGTFDAAICIDSIIHIPNRENLLKECARVLKPSGRLLYTDPTVISGPVSNEELAIRSSIGFFLFVPPGENEKMIRVSGGLALLKNWDATENMLQVSGSWHRAREKKSSQLKNLEGEKNFEGLQRFLATVHELAAQRRLCREVILAKKEG